MQIPCINLSWFIHKSLLNVFRTCSNAFTILVPMFVLFYEDTFVGRWRYLREAMKTSSMAYEGTFIGKGFFDSSIERFGICFRQSAFYGISPKRQVTGRIRTRTLVTCQSIIGYFALYHCLLEHLLLLIEISQFFPIALLSRIYYGTRIRKYWYLTNTVS